MLKIERFTSWCRIWLSAPENSLNFRWPIWSGRMPNQVARRSNQVATGQWFSANDMPVTEFIRRSKCVTVRYSVLLMPGLRPVHTDSSNRYMYLSMTVFRETVCNCDAYTQLGSCLLYVAAIPVIFRKRLSSN